ncbi:hypothetical protein Suden_1001 [Sulfurimonas denitrificans DSM 1251]|uniref:Lipoprotein n=1 Tax=Sulfurimonas denitrificans (strain ATCC 33889 / DSM 1251) TaxID=326298 RepID=Q30RV2_SULDN|nr:hypothetical protein [Sulfurimonas denitrificans]ABB44279.1 hypothetical protein Suden_1001 [Sulfurimonas denitrificans DSM 1251]MDD3443113.1 hypothetical protein [Sulfurimonas denitrificans]
MIKVLLIPLFFMLFSGCVDKKNVLFIDNMGICTKSMATLHLREVEMQNNAQTFNVTSDELTLALVNALKETNCFVVLTSKTNSLDSKDDYFLDVKVNLSQDKEKSKQNIFKTVEKEHLQMLISLNAYNNGNKVVANAKSEIVIDKSKILGFKPESDTLGDKRMLIKNATKQVSIAISDGFLKLR